MIDIIKLMCSYLFDYLLAVALLHIVAPDFITSDSIWVPTTYLTIALLAFFKNIPKNNN